MSGAKDTVTRDPERMLDAVRHLGDQIDATWRRARSLVLPDGFREARAVIVAGMGGSAIGGDLAAELFGDVLRVPMVVVRDYRLPAWAGPQTLCIVSSYSGNTPEALSARADAIARGAPRVIVTSGGRLAQAARASGEPVVDLPPGGSPRAALGASLAALAAILAAAATIPEPGADLERATAAMRSLVEDCDRSGENAPCVRLARLMAGKIAFVYAPQRLGAVARRWKTQINENAKSTAVWDTLPELDHNAVEGFRRPADVLSRAHFVFLTGPSTPPAAAARIAATASLLAERGLEHSVVEAPPGPGVAQALWLVQYGDLMSVHLAYAHGVDPTPVPEISRLKAMLGDPGA